MSLTTDRETRTTSNAHPARTTFAEEALKLGGKGAEEVRRMGAVDAADDQVETLFALRYQTVNSPLHRAIWDRDVPVNLFESRPREVDHDAQRPMQDSLAVIRRHKAAGTLLDAERKISRTVLEELAQAGYWGLLVDKKYGGSGVPFAQFARFLTTVATLDPTTAGLASVHGCIGAVDPVQTFGTEEQKRRFLPKLASGERLSAFALTEPCAGSDLTALRTTARLEGRDYVVNGEKLFITNVVPGRTIGLVCLIDGQPAVLIADLPEEENEHFQLKKYGLYALKHTHNQGIVFRDFRVPAENLLLPDEGDGLTVAYHGLNRGRVSLCANAAGTMRMMLANMLPWAHHRRTYGAAIETRELVQRRMGQMAGLIVACDALVDWCGGLLDEGYRGEMECIVAKIFGSEAQKEAAIELFMKTHGGRSFLQGHLFGDNVHEFLAPCIYEGEGEMLGLALFKSLVKQHGRQFFEPIGKVLQSHHIRQPNMANPSHLWALRGPLWDYSKWFAARNIQAGRHAHMPPLPGRLRRHAEFASDFLHQSALEISGVLRKHQLQLADRQCRMAEMSTRVQWATVILCTSLYAARQDSELIRDAADSICTTLTDRLTQRRTSDKQLRALTQLGAAIAEGRLPELAEIPPEPILMPYANAPAG